MSRYEIIQVEIDRLTTRCRNASIDARHRFRLHERMELLRETQLSLTIDECTQQGDL